MAEVSEPVTFSREIEGSMSDLIVPEEFIRDFYFSSDEHLMIMIRVIGTDYAKVRDFFQDSEGQTFTLKTISPEREISGEFILVDMYMDEGPPLGVDINIEQPMVRLILDFKTK